MNQSASGLEDNIVLTNMTVPAIRMQDVRSCCTKLFWHHLDVLLILCWGRNWPLQATRKSGDAAGISTMKNAQTV